MDGLGEGERNDLKLGGEIATLSYTDARGT